MFSAEILGEGKGVGMEKIVLKKTVNSNGNYSCDELDITVDEWKSVLQDISIHENYKLWLARFYWEPGHKASCKQMGEKFNCHPQSPNSIITNFGKAVQKILNRFEVRGTDNELTYWIIPMKAGCYVDGYFEWTMRDELVQAMEELKMTNSDQFEGSILQKIYNDSLNSRKDWYTSDWAKKYNEIVSIVKQNVEHTEWSDDCKYRVLKSSNNGISGINWGLSNDEYAKILTHWAEFESIFNGIVHSQSISKEIYSVILDKIRNITGKSFEVIVNRVIGALLPGRVSSIPKPEMFYEQLDIVKRQFPEFPEITHDWLTDNLNFFAYCREKVTFQNENHISGFLGILSNYCTSQGDPTMQGADEKLKEYVDLLKSTKNLILTGAPGTGKTHLAKKIAEDMGCTTKEIGFVQFHPSYDYTDFVEGLRPVQDESGSGQIGFERKDGVFKEFCERALKNLQDSRKSIDVLQQEKSVNEIIEDFLNDAIEQKTQFETITKNIFFVDNLTDKKIFVSIPKNEKVKSLPIPIDDILKLINNNIQLNISKDVSEYFKRKWRMQQDSYIFSLTKKIQEIVRNNKNKQTDTVEQIQEKNFVFIIDEINRGEVAKIFGELFYSVDPGYRVTAKDIEEAKSEQKTITTIRTQYANLEIDGNAFDNALNIVDENDYGHFFVPENVYIIGTMNDIDRSVESMDFAFRRRFAWAEVRASDTMGMLDPGTDENGNPTGTGLESSDLAKEAKERMVNLNRAISEDFGPAYEIGASYFLKLKQHDGDFEKLWQYHIKGILEEYLRGHPEKTSLMEKFRAAYFSKKATIPEGKED